MTLRPYLLWSLLIAGCFGTTALAYWGFSRTTPTDPQTSQQAIPVGFRVTPESIDFGTLIQGETVTREVTVFNGTSESWVIDLVVPSCGCSAGAVSSPDLAVSAQVSLKVLFNSAGKYGEQKHVVRLFLHSVDDPQHKEQILVSLTTNVKTIVWIEPEVVTFKGCTLGGQSSERFTLHCAEGHSGTEPPRLVGPPGADLQEFQLSPRGPLKAGANELELKFTPKQTSGRRGLNLQIDPGLFNHPPVAIQIDASVPSQFQVEPAEVYLGTLRPGELKTIKVRITAGIVLYVVDHCPEFLKATLSGDAGLQELTVVLLPEHLSPSTVIRDNIRLKTGSLSEPILYLSVLGLVSNGGTRP